MISLNINIFYNNYKKYFQIVIYLLINEKHVFARHNFFI